MCRVEEHHCLLVLDILPSGDSGTRKFIRTPCRGGLDSQAAVMCSVKARQEYRRQIHAIHVAEKREPTATATSCSRFDRTKHVELDTGQSLAICNQKWVGVEGRETGIAPATAAAVSRWWLTGNAGQTHHGGRVLFIRMEMVEPHLLSIRANGRLREG